MYIGQTERKVNPRPTEGDLVKIDGEWFYKISNVDNMPPFFMSIVSDANHWMFIASQAGCGHLAHSYPQMSMFRALLKYQKYITQHLFLQEWFSSGVYFIIVQ